MNLIKIPKEYDTVPIISFHHGDPSNFEVGLQVFMNYSTMN